MVEENLNATCEEKAEAKTQPARLIYREVPAELIESAPENGALSHWVLASPMLLFLAWLWIDLFAHFSPISYYWLDAALGVVVYLCVIVLPLGVAAFYLVTSFPRLFGHAGWDVQPLEPVSEAEMYAVRYRYLDRRRAAASWEQSWKRAAQGWVYLEVAAILIGGVAMIPIFFSVSEFGFGQ
jgi:hypothetical protein